MRTNVNTRIGASNSYNAPRNALDMTVENPRQTKAKGYSVETRYDIESLSGLNQRDMVAAVTLVNGTTFRLSGTLPQAKPVTPVTAQEVVHLFSTDSLRAVALGQSTVVFLPKIGYTTVYSVQDAADKMTESRRAAAGTAVTHPEFGEPLSIYRVSSRLQAALGFTPRVAYKVKG